jgi:hypothetical protein
MVHLYHAIMHRNEKEQTTATGNNMTLSILNKEN